MAAPAADRPEGRARRLDLGLASFDPLVCSTPPSLMEPVSILKPANVLRSGQCDNGASPALVFDLEGHHHAVPVLRLPQGNRPGNRVP
jgi:hypothetical protein